MCDSYRAFIVEKKGRNQQNKYTNIANCNITNSNFSLFKVSIYNSLQMIYQSNGQWNSTYGYTTKYNVNRFINNNSIKSYLKDYDNKILCTGLISKDAYYFVQPGFENINDNDIVFVYMTYEHKDNVVIAYDGYIASFNLINRIGICFGDFAKEISQMINETNVSIENRRRFYNDYIEKEMSKTECVKDYDENDEIYEKEANKIFDKSDFVYDEDQTEYETSIIKEIRKELKKNKNVDDCFSFIRC